MWGRGVQAKGPLQVTAGSRTANLRLALLRRALSKSVRCWRVNTCLQPPTQLPLSVIKKACAGRGWSAPRSRALNGADRVQKGLGGAFDLSSIIGQRQHFPADLFDLPYHAHKISHDRGGRARSRDGVGNRTTIRASHKGDDVRHHQPFVLLLGRGSQASICAYPPERKFLWIVRRLFLLGNREGVNIHHQLGERCDAPGSTKDKVADRPTRLERGSAGGLAAGGAC